MQNPTPKYQYTGSALELCECGHSKWWHDGNKCRGDHGLGPCNCVEFRARKMTLDEPDTGAAA